MPMLQLSASPQAHTAPPKYTASNSYKPTISRPYLPPQTPPPNQSHKSLTFSTPITQLENPQFRMPASLWPNTTIPTVNFLQPHLPQQFALILASYPPLSAINTFTQPNYTHYPYPHTPHYNPPYYTPPN